MEYFDIQRIRTLSHIGICTSQFRFKSNAFCWINYQFDFFNFFKKLCIGSIVWKSYINNR